MASRGTALFIALFAICYFFYTILFTYISGVGRSMKRHFQVSDCGLGWLYAASGLAYAIAVLATAYFGGRASRRARYVGGGFLVIALGCVLLVISAFVAPLPLVEHPKDEGRFWKSAFSPLTMEDISSSKLLAKTQVAARFPVDVRHYLSENDFKLETAGRARRGVAWPRDKVLMVDDAMNRLRRDLYMENVEENGSPDVRRRLSKRELPDWSFPDDLKDKLVAGFTDAVLFFHVLGFDPYSKFATKLYNLTNDPEIYIRIMKASRLPFGYCRNTSSITRGKLNEERCNQSQSAGAVGGFVLALIGFALIGIGSTPIWTVALSIMDDDVSKSCFPFCLAGIFSLHWVPCLVGAAAGLLLEFKLYANLYPSQWLTPIDPRWVGAWWLAFACVALPLLLVGLCFILFVGAFRRGAYNRAPAQENDHSLNSARAGGEELGTWKRFVYAIFACCRPPIFVALLLALTCDALSIKGYFDFLPKFFENNYSPNIWQSALPFWLYLIGIVVGGVVCRLLDGRRAAFFIVTCTLVAAILSLAQSHPFFGCNSVVRQVQVAGLANSANGRPIWPTCRGCICDTAELYPVCANNTESTPYYSPCHAGCTNFTYAVVGTNVEFTFDYCYCAPAVRLNVSRSLCKDDCAHPTKAYLVLSSLAAVLSGSVIVPVILFVLRTAIPEFRALALGIIGLAVCLFGLLPSALIYRFIADSTCFLWRAPCRVGVTGHRPICEIFDGPLLRERLHLFLGVLRLLSVLFYGLVLYHAKGVKLYVTGGGNRETTFEADMRECPQKDDRGPPKYAAVGTTNNSLMAKM